LHLAGHFNWLLNVLPWGWPALTELYCNISGKIHLYHGIHINAEVTQDLLWLKDVIPRSLGVLFTDVGRWCDSEADMVVWTDASFRGLSFVYAGNGFMYQIQSVPSDVKVDIFFFPPSATSSHFDSLLAVFSFIQIVLTV
jgi:hypothetical protein